MLGKSVFGDWFISGKIFYIVYLQTIQLVCLNEIFDLFYLTNKNQITITVKQDLFFLIDFMILAH